MKMQFNFKNREFLSRVMIIAILLLITVPMFAQGGETALVNASTEIKKYWAPTKVIIQAIGAVVGLIGGIRIYNKWINGDQDINKEIVGWGGACLFLLIVPQFVGAFFGM